MSDFSILFQDNEVESKKRKATKSAPKKGGWKKKTAAVTVGDSQHVTCCALACTNTSESCTLVSLPTDPHLREQWLHNIDRQDWTPSRDSMLCQIHFEPDLWEEDKDGKKSLKPDAVPSLFLHGETIKSWDTLDREGNVNNVHVRFVSVFFFFVVKRSPYIF
ncbi:DNA binding, variant 2 [Homalodisca vitripennis]|nr:DNA binding, variant 2 [Homalodisca vitripennis]